MEIFRAQGPKISIVDRLGGTRPGPFLYYYRAPFRSEKVLGPWF